MHVNMHYYAIFMHSACVHVHVHVHMYMHTEWSAVLNSGAGNQRFYNYMYMCM